MNFSMHRDLLPELQHYLDQIVARPLPVEAATPRSEQRERFIEYLREAQLADRPVRLLFVCTHNPRRSHMAQAMALAAAAYYRYPQKVEAYSGGTGVTALNPRAREALQAAGFRISGDGHGDDPNPRYHLQYLHESRAQSPLLLFSKLINDAHNPITNFAAIMTCDSADAACPIVPGAGARISLPFADPGAFDDRPELADAAYQERLAQIARELLFIFEAATSKRI